MNYAELTNYRLNKLVVEKLGKEFIRAALSVDDGVMVLQGSELVCFDPCSNACDAWPIITENKISLITVGDEWEAHVIDDELQDEAHNIIQVEPLRAAMICFLSMESNDENE